MDLMRFVRPEAAVPDAALEVVLDAAAFSSIDPTRW